MADATPKTMPWTVIIYPPWYDDEDDHGYGWSGEATDEKDAVRQACEACLVDNDVDEWAADPADYKLDPETVDYSDAHYDYRVLYERLTEHVRDLLDRWGDGNLSQQVQALAKAINYREET